MKIIPALILFAILPFSCASQTFYYSLKGDSLRKAGQTEMALEEYQKTYLSDPSNQTNTYNYACLLAKTRKNDSAFKYLVIASAQKVDSSPLTDPDLLPLRNDPRWTEYENKLIELIQKQLGKPYKDLEYSKILWKMRATDQAYYEELEQAEKKLGNHSLIVYAIWDLKEKLNHENQEQLEKLIATKGWPLQSQVGTAAAGAAFLIIQHATLEKQKKYLPIIRDLCQKNEARWDAYALMYDRIQTSENKPQRYGSQVRFNEKSGKYELFPLEDRSKVDQWRAEAGLGPLSEYVAHWNIVLEPQK